MITEEQLQEIVAKVIARLARRLGATGDKGELIVVFSAATVEFREAVMQVRDLILDGFQVRLAFSPAAENLLSSAVKQQLDGFPHVSMVEPAHWLTALRNARAVVAPLLSLNTLSKLSLLIADNTVTNIILHGLLMGKPVVMAANGADPREKGREELGFHNGNTALKRAIDQRLRTVEEYGCMVTDIRKLRKTVKALLIGEDDPALKRRRTVSMESVPTRGLSRRFITAADVLHACRTGANLNVGHTTRLTPLAQDLARRYGVVLMTDGGRSV